MNDVPSSGSTSISKSSSSARVLPLQPNVPPSHRSPVWTTWSLTRTCANTGVPPASASSRLSQRAWNTCHEASASCAVGVGEPYQVTTTWPAEPAAIAGSTAVRVSAPLLTRTGLDQVGVSVDPASADTHTYTSWSSENAT